MTSSYSTDLKLELMVTGENAGTWGDNTNNNLNLIQQAIAGFESVALSDGGTVALAMTDKTISNARNMVLKFTGTLTSASTVTIPDSIEKFYIFDLSAVTGVTNLTIKTVSGTGFTAGEAKIVAAYSDGTNLNEIALNTLGGTIATAQIDDNAITSAKISANQVTTAKIADNAITSAKISANQVTTAKIADNAITSAKISANQVTAAKVSNDIITGQSAETSVADTDQVLIADASDSNNLKKMTVANLVANAGGGRVLQVITATDSTVRSTSSTSFTTASNTLSVTITPSATSSKILLLLANGNYTSNRSFTYAIFRGATNLSGAAGSEGFYSGERSGGEGWAIMHLDSPNTTSATTYNMQTKEKTSIGDGTTSFNTTRNGDGSNLYSLIAMEIDGS